MWGVNKWEHEKEGELSHCRQMFNRIHVGSNSGWVFMKIRQDSLSPKTELCFKSGSQTTRTTHFLLDLEDWYPPTNN